MITEKTIAVLYAIGAVLFWVFGILNGDFWQFWCGVLSAFIAADNYEIRQHKDTIGQIRRAA